MVIWKWEWITDKHGWTGSINCNYRTLRQKQDINVWQLLKLQYRYNLKKYQNKIKTIKKDTSLADKTYENLPLQ